MDLLRHLRFFVTVADVRHFGHAATDLRMTQPPLSQGIARLERRLGVRLFDRNARGVRITPAGAALLPLARDLVEAGERFDDTAAQIARTRRPVVLGIPPGLESVGVRVAAAAAAACPLPVRPAFAGTVDLVEGVVAGRLDLAVARHPAIVDGTTPGRVHRLPTSLLLPAGTSMAGFVTHGLPVAAWPRRHHPAAHDQMVDALRRLGHPGATTTITDEAQAAALVAAGAAARLALSVGRAADPSATPVEVTDGGLVTRVRVLGPALGSRDDLDVTALGEAVDSALEQAAS